MAVWGGVEEGGGGRRKGVRPASRAKLFTSLGDRRYLWPYRVLGEEVRTLGDAGTQGRVAVTAPE